MMAHWLDKAVDRSVFCYVSIEKALREQQESGCSTAGQERTAGLSVSSRAGQHAFAYLCCGEEMQCRQCLQNTDAYEP